MNSFTIEVGSYIEHSGRCYKVIEIDSDFLGLRYWFYDPDENIKLYIHEIQRIGNTNKFY